MYTSIGFANTFFSVQVYAEELRPASRELRARRPGTRIFTVHLHKVLQWLSTVHTA